MKRPKSTEGEGGQQSTAGDKSQTPEGTERYRLNHLMGSTEEHKSEDSPATQARIQDAESTTTTNQQLERQQSAMHAAMNQALKEPLGKTHAHTSSVVPISTHGAELLLQHIFGELFWCWKQRTNKGF